MHVRIVSTAAKQKRDPERKEVKPKEKFRKKIRLQLQAERKYFFSSNSQKYFFPPVMCKLMCCCVDDLLC
jgi:hypothetical protein